MSQFIVPKSDRAAAPADGPPQKGTAEPPLEPSKSLFEEMDRSRGLGSGGNMTAFVLFTIATGVLPVLVALFVGRLWADFYVLVTRRKERLYRVWLRAYYWSWPIMIGGVLVYAYFWA